MYKDIKSCVINNGFASAPFTFKEESGKVAHYLLTCLFWALKYWVF